MPKRAFRSEISAVLHKPSKHNHGNLNKLEEQLNALILKARATSGIDTTHGTPAAAIPKSFEPPNRRGDPPPRVPERRKLTIDGGIEAKGLRKEVTDARGRLFKLDSETTSLQVELKKTRTVLWEKQREQCSAEARIGKTLEGRASELGPKIREEEEKLLEEERGLARELSEVRAVAAHWISVAKRQDAMLQQEREQGREKESSSHWPQALMKHPCGEVFGLPVPPPAESRDRGDMPYLGSSDDEMEESMESMDHWRGRKEDQRDASSSIENLSASGNSEPPRAPSQSHRALKEPTSPNSEASVTSNSDDDIRIPGRKVARPGAARRRDSGPVPATLRGGRHAPASPSNSDGSSPAASPSATAPKSQTRALYGGMHGGNDSDSTSDEDQEGLKGSSQSKHSRSGAGKNQGENSSLSQSGDQRNGGGHGDVPALPSLSGIPADADDSAQVEGSIDESIESSGSF